MIPLSITDKEFRQLAQYIYIHYGIYLKDEKKALVTGRLQHRVQAKGFYSFSDYYRYVVDDKTGEAANELINSISTNYTFFMREKNHFNYLKTDILPSIVPQISDHDLRIWCAGCSTGEEAYTLAMTIQEFFGQQKLGWDTTLLATDVSTNALQKAVSGEYFADAIAPLPSKWKMNYFRKINEEQYEVVPQMKQEVIFRRFNLMERFPFRRKFHVIFCRNVMIYFDAPTKEKLVKKFYDALEPGGYLFIGQSEGLERNQYGFQYVVPSVYRKV